MSGEGTENNVILYKEQSPIFNYEEECNGRIPLLNGAYRFDSCHPPINMKMSKYYLTYILTFFYFFSLNLTFNCYFR